jgi:AcrR family transcriptional regulator
LHHEQLLQEDDGIMTSVTQPGASSPADDDARDHERQRAAALVRRTPGSGAARARRPQARTAMRRQEILEAAMAVFAVRGYRNASLAEIADRVGMTHAGVLHHFASKEQLLVEVLEYRDSSDVQDLEGHHAPTGLELLRHLIRTAATNEQRPGIVQSYSVLSAEAVTEDHPAQEWFRSRYAGLRQMISEAIVEGLGPGAAPDEPELSAATAAIIAMMDGLQVQWLLEPAAIDMPSSVQLVIDVLLEHWRRAAGSAGA